jgi:hypothetical protein
MLRLLVPWSATLRNAAARFFARRAYIYVMSYLRVRTIKGRGYLYRQTSVRKGKKVKTISEYLGALFWMPIAAASPGRPGGYKGHKSTDARANRHQAQSDRERFDKEMENPKERFAREATKAAAARAGRATVKMDETAQKKWDEGMEAVREFNEARAKEKEPPGPQDGS